MQMVAYFRSRNVETSGALVDNSLIRFFVLQKIEKDRYVSSNEIAKEINFDGKTILRPSP